MPRSIWNGTVAFGLVRVPVKLYSATESKRIPLRERHAKDGAAIEHRRLCVKEGREVPYSEIVKGYEVSEGSYVVLTKEEVAAAEGPEAHVVEIEHFVDREQIDPAYYERSYYLGPGKLGEEPYRLLQVSLERSGRVGIGRFVFHNKAHLVAIRAVEDVIVLHTMRFVDELNSGDELDPAKPQKQPSKLELDTAQLLLGQLDAKFEPESYANTYRDAVMALIEKKARGETHRGARNLAVHGRGRSPGRAGSKPCPTRRHAAQGRHEEALGLGGAPRQSVQSLHTCHKGTQAPGAWRGQRVSRHQTSEGHRRAQAQADARRGLMARPLWTGSLSFGLVTVPVALYSAVRDRDIHFNLLHGPDNSPIETRRMCAHEQREVPWQEIVKGYELDDGRWVLLSDADLEAAAPRKSHTIDIEAFVEEREIDPLYLDRPYLLVPEDEAAARAYALLSEAMAASGKVALGRFVMRAKENLVSIRPRGDLLALTTMRFHDEVRPSAEIAQELASAPAPSEDEIENAMAIIAELEVPFEPEGYRDEHRAHLEAIVKRKRKGQKISVPKAKPAKPQEPAPVAPDLMGALQESLARIKGEAASKDKEPAKRKRKPPAPKAPAKRASARARRS